ncbi:MAG: hypothetical protein M3322_00955 [Actinomycetota bacterium]|nr:hypothetical protein [Actinomycetota bacterium]
MPHRRANAGAWRRSCATTWAKIVERSGEGGVVLRAGDNGVGLSNTRQAARYWILGMRERAMLIGATLTIANHPEGGVDLTLTAPPAQ